MRKNIPSSRLTTRQVLCVLAARAAQNGIKKVSLGKVKPHWSLPLAIHYVNKNREHDLNNLESIDIEPDPYSLVYC